MAVEDIGLADPRALRVTLDACETYERLGSPEGELALAEAVLYLAVAAKSNAVYEAYNAARDFISRDGTRPVPLHIRNAPTRLMKNLGYGKGYRYAHDEPDAFSAGRDLLSRGHAGGRVVQADRARPRGADPRRRLGRAEKQEMIDIQLLRKDPEGVAKRLATRGAGAFDAVLFQRYESTRKDLQTAVEQAQASRNRIAKDIGQAKAKGQDVAPLLEQGEKLKALLEKSEVQLTALQARSRNSSSACRTSRTSRCRSAPRRRTTARSGAGASRASSISRSRTTSTSARRSAGSTSPPAPRSRAAASW